MVGFPRDGFNNEMPPSKGPTSYFDKIIWGQMMIGFKPICGEDGSLDSVSQCIHYL